MKIDRSGFQINILSIAVVTLAVTSLFDPKVAAAQPARVVNAVETFLNAQSDPNLTNSNLGRSAIAINRACVMLAVNGAPTTAAVELSQRCGELVGTADRFNPGAAVGLPDLGYAQADELLAAFQQVNGEETQSTSNMSLNASNEQFSIVAGRLAALRGATSASATSVVGNNVDFMYGFGGGAAADDGLAFGPWGWFVRGSYTTGDRDPTDPNLLSGAENGFDFDQYGLTIGIDRASVSTVWGFALGFTNYEVDMQERTTGSGIQTKVVDGGKIDSESYNGSFYYDYTAQNNVYFSALAGYGQQSFDMSRAFIYFGADPNAATVGDQTRLMTANPDGDSIGLSMTIGKMIDRGSWVIDPRLGLSFDRVNVDGFAEVDTGNVNAGNPNSTVAAMQFAFNKQEFESIRTNLGIQFSNNINTSFGSVRPTFSADWYHEFRDDPRTIQAKYAVENDLAASGAAGGWSGGFGNCVSCFSLLSEAPDSDFYVVGAGVAAAYRGGFQMFLMLEGLLGYQNLNAYSATVGLRGQF
jgi:outer membrane autotransporter protein